MSIARRAARSATYRLARRGGIAALLVFLGGLWAARTPAPRRPHLGDQDASTAWTRATGTRLVTVKELAGMVEKNYPDGSHAVDLARAVLEFIAREEARDGDHA